MGRWFEILLSVIFRVFLGVTRKALLQKSKIKALKVYLLALRALRLSMLACLGFFMLIQLLFFSAIFALGALIYLLPWSFEAKVYLVLTLSALILSVIGGLFFYLFSERLWLKASGADKMIESLFEAKRP